MIEYFKFEPEEANVQELYAFLKEVDAYFQPPISKKIDLRSYAEKMANNATNFVARDNGQIIGFSSTYINKAPELSFGTFVCVKKEYQKDGLIGTELMLSGNREAKAKGSRGVWCMIRKSDVALWKFYKRLGYSIVKEVPVEGSDVIELHIEKIF